MFGNAIPLRFIHLFALLLPLLGNDLNALAQDVRWKLTVDQLSYHESSFRIEVASDGRKVGFVKKSRSKDFEKVGESLVDAQVLDELRRLTVKLEAEMQSSEPKSKSARDADVRYRVIYERGSAEVELRWLAGQFGRESRVSTTYRDLVQLLNQGNGLNVQLKPDPVARSN